MKQIDISADLAKLLDDHFSGLHSGGGRSSILGGQSAANKALGDGDPALVANPELPVVFIFDEAALRKLNLSSKRIFFYLEVLADLSQRRELQVYLGDPTEFSKEHALAVTYAPVPSFAKYSDLAEIHPYPWLRQPHAKSVRSFSAWRGK